MSYNSRNNYTRIQAFGTPSAFDPSRTSKSSNGISNPITETLYPATNDIDLGKIDAPFRKLYVQNQTIELVNTLDNAKSGKISVDDGNLVYSSNSDVSNVCIGFDAGLTAGENSTSIGNFSNENSTAPNLISIGFQAGRDDNKSGSISIGNGAHISHGGVNAISIGTSSGAGIAGSNGDNSICIGQSAGQTTASDNSIILNATGNQLNSNNSGLYIKPIRTDNTSLSNLLQYDLSSGEITSTNITPIDINPFNYIFDTTITTPPLSGQLRFNNVIQNDATRLFLSNTTSNGNFVELYTDNITTLSKIIIQDKNNSNNYITLSVITTPVFYVDYADIEIFIEASNGTGSTNFGLGTALYMSIITNENKINTKIVSVENKTQNIDESKTNNTRTYFNHIIESDTGFKITGGTNLQYLLADGSTTTSSGNNENSNIYLYKNNTTTSPPPSNGQIRYNDSVQQLATILYISHRTRDTIDIDPFLSQITTLNLIYIQDQEVSLNYIKYNVSGNITIIPNIYIVVPVSYNIGEGTGLTSFGAGHNIFMSIFTNTTEIDTRLSTLETKTQNQTAIASTTTFTGIVNATKLQANNTIIVNAIVTNLTMNNSEMTSLSGVANVSYGPSCAVNLTTGNSNTFMGYRSGLSLASSNYNTGYGQDTLRNCTAGHNTAVGGSSSTNIITGTNNTSIGLQSLFYNISGNDCVAVGSNALQQNLTSGNTALGNNAGNTATQYSNITALGANALPDASDQIMLGNTDVTEVKSSGVFNGAGFTISGTSGKLQYTVASTTLESGSTITPTRNIHFVSGTIPINTITNPFGTPSSGQITLIPSGLWTTTTAGNIALPSVAVKNKALILTWDSVTTKWYPSY